MFPNRVVASICGMVMLFAFLSAATLPFAEGLGLYTGIFIFGILLALAVFFGYASHVVWHAQTLWPVWTLALLLSLAWMVIVFSAMNDYGLPTGWASLHVYIAAFLPAIGSFFLLQRSVPLPEETGTAL